MNELTEFVDSKFIFDYIYSPLSPIHNAPEGVRNALSTPLKAMRAIRPVEGFSGENNNHLPTCAVWWNRGEGAKKGLRDRLLTNLTDDVLLSAGRVSYIPACQYDPPGVHPQYTNGKLKNREECLQKIKDTLTSHNAHEKGSKEEILGNKLLLNYQGTQAHIKDRPAEAEEGKIFLLALGALAVGVISTYFGVDLSGGMIGTVVSFYLSVFIIKLMLKFLLPMVIMTIYMFWGIYMLIGEMRGSTLVKGMVTIFSLTIIPGLWAIADHLDDKLWEAMYDSWIDSPIQMILLDAASGIFYLGIMMVVFYLINLAGVGDAGGTLTGVQNRAEGLSGKVGATGTTSAGNTWKWFTSGQKDKQGKIVSGGYWTKLKAGAKNGWNTMRSK